MMIQMATSAKSPMIVDTMRKFGGRTSPTSALLQSNPMRAYLSIVTGAQFEVGDYGFKRVLFLRLRFSTVRGAVAVKNPEWDGSPGLARKSGLISTLISHHFTAAQKTPPQTADVNINSAIYPGGPSGPAQAPKLLKFVDTTEMTRGPQEAPGYWVVSGARLMVEKGRISLRVKYSLLAVILPDEEVPEES